MTTIDTSPEAVARVKAWRKLLHAAFHLMDDSATDAQTDVISIDNEIAADDLKALSEALDELGVHDHESIDEAIMKITPPGKPT